MKRSVLLLLAMACWFGCAVQAQDAATEERMNQLRGKIEDLIASQEVLRKQIAEISRELNALRDEQGKPSGLYASNEDLNRVAEAVKEVDRKRLEDYEKIRAELLKLGKTLAAPTPNRRTTPDTGEKRAAPEKGYEYVIQKDDTLSMIAAAYRERNINVTPEQILKANPGLKAERLQIGQKIFIPAPK